MSLPFDFLFGVHSQETASSLDNEVKVVEPVVNTQRLSFSIV